MLEKFIFVQMENRFNSYSKIIYKYRYLVIAIITLASWAPVLFVPFINDDYQILGYHLNKGFISLFQPFWRADISQYYWRPLGNIIHPLVLMIGGFNPIAFRITSLLIYLFCGFIILKALDKIGFSKSVSMLAVSIFMVLPSHELEVAWIADAGESLFTSFLLLSFINYYDGYENESNKKLLFSILFFIAAVLIKETAFAGIFIPVIVVVAKGDFTKKKIFRTSSHVLVAFAAVIFILVYRFVFIGGTPFNSIHFANSGPIKWILNLLIYIPLSFFPPEALERLLYLSHNIFWMFLFAIAFISLIYLLVKLFLKFDKREKRIVFTGVLWFTIFVIPALPNLMRWYIFAASFGFVIIIAIILEHLFYNNHKQKIIYILILFFILITSAYNFSLMMRWEKAGEKLDKALVSLDEMKNEIKSDTIFVWGIPDKLNRVPMMKLGVKETVQWALDTKKIEVLAPLRVELINENSKVKLVSFSDSSLVFEVVGGRFLREGSESRSIIQEDVSSFNYEGNKYRIETKIDKSKNVLSSVEIILNKKIVTGKDQFYFDGEKFINIGRHIKTIKKQNPGEI
ncbi:MAG: hypothetical protein NTX22_15375 [Ignavibacteriales bacterium]|nr:hypothetical protein [Ignavibacteriales bacterium]